MDGNVIPMETKEWMARLKKSVMREVIKNLERRKYWSPWILVKLKRSVPFTVFPMKPLG